MQQPDSLLTAAKKVAQATGMKWADVHLVYRALQEGTLYWLPRSFGRNICLADPKDITSLLTGLAAASEPSEASAAVAWTKTLTLGGKADDDAERPSQLLCPFDIEFSVYLRDPAAADELVSIEFQPDTLRVIFNRRSGRPRIFERHQSTSTPTPNVAAFIQKRGVIAGTVIQELARCIKWGTEQDGKLKKVSTGTVDEEA